MELGNKQAEHYLLACIMADNSILDEVSVKVKVEDFFGAIHQVIYGTMLKMYKSHKKIDLTTLIDAISLAGKVDDIGGLGTIVNLNVATTANYQSYVEIIKRESIKKQVLIAVRKINEIAKESDNANALLGEAQRIFESIDATDNAASFDSAGEVASEVITELFENSDKDCTGIKTGFVDLDKILDGLHESELVILAARPAMGKTALALNILLNVSAHEPVLMFSLEMSKNELVKRLLSLITGLSGESLKHPTRLPEHLQSRIWQACNTINERKIVISDKAEQTLAEIKSTTRQVKHKYKGLGLVVVDYLTLIKSNVKNGNRENEVSEISRGLKMLAKEFRVPVLALAQVNRGTEGRQDKKPGLADLRESGAIEQDADIVMFLYRDEYYNKATDKKNQADVIVAKHRNGPIGDVVLYFDSRLTKFSNVDLRNR